MGELTLIVPKSSKLKSAKAERAFMLKFRRDHELKDGGVEPVTDVAVLAALERPYDWVHSAAHGVSLGKGTGEAPLLLDKGSIKPSDIYGLAIERPLLQAPSFVFNACQVGQEDWTVFGTSGWATQLVGRGAGLFIAPLWSVTDALAYEFVIALYNELAAGKTVGEAVLAGRLKARESARQAGDPADPTWLAYCVYALVARGVIVLHGPRLSYLKGQVAPSREEPSNVVPLAEHRIRTGRRSGPDRDPLLHQPSVSGIEVLAVATAHELIDPVLVSGHWLKLAREGGEEQSARRGGYHGKTLDAHDYLRGSAER